MKYTSLLLLLSLILYTCTNPETKTERLPYLGVNEISESGDTIRHTIQPFSFLSQDSALITEEYLKNKITIVDFFFSTCPTICPIMSTNMRELQQLWETESSIQFLSHTVDPETDTPNRLKRYAERKNADLKNWQFVTGEKNELYTQGLRSYLVSTQEDVLAPGGFLHSSLFALIDKNLHLRGVYDGTSKKDIEQLNKDIKILLNEK